MASKPRSAEITQVYRTSLLAVRAATEDLMERLWQSVDPFAIDESMDRLLPVMDAVVTSGQAQAVQLADLYVATYLTSETGELHEPAGLAGADFAGRTRDGRPVSDVLALSGTSMKLATVAGAAAGGVLLAGLARAQRTTRTEVVSAAWVAQDSLTQTSAETNGWRRVASGEPCAACMALAGAKFSDGVVFSIHGSCSCTAEPIVRGLPENHPPATGKDTFNAMTPEQQDALYGDRAGLLRDGDIGFDQLVEQGDAYEWGPMLWEAPVTSLAG